MRYLCTIHFGNVCKTNLQGLHNQTAFIDNALFYHEVSLQGGAQLFFPGNECLLFVS